MSEQLKDIGEFGLIARFARRAEGSLNEKVTGIGDDAAIIPQSGRTVQLVTCDTLVENIHFKKEYIKPVDLGYKSLAVNLSDIAAMGGTSRYVFLSLALPVETDLDWMERFLDGFCELAEAFNIQLLGGDTTRSEQNIVITCTVLGEAETGHVKKRSDARSGDSILVTGTLGDSGGGLKVLKRGGKGECLYEKKLISAHNRPLTFCRQGAWLGSLSAIHAMIDISDGLISDAGHIAESSGLGMHIDLERIPVSEELQEASFQMNIDPYALALSAGEDYHLLITAAPHNVSKLKKQYQKEFGKPLFEIGKVVSGRSDVSILKKGKKLESYSQGFDHFKS